VRTCILMLFKLFAPKDEKYVSFCCVFVRPYKKEKRQKNGLADAKDKVPIRKMLSFARWDTVMHMMQKSMTLLII
jgi:hypothetical protein